jgi:hypothetical protein
LRRHPALLEEGASKVVPVREDPVLLREEGAAAVDEVEAGERVLRRDLLGAKMLLHRLVEEGAALHGGVVGDDHAGHAGHDADAGHDAGARDLVAVKAPGGEGGQLQEGRQRVEEEVDALAHRDLAALDVAAPELGAAALQRAPVALAEVVNEQAERRRVLGKGRAVGLDAGLDGRQAWLPRRGGGGGRDFREKRRCVRDRAEPPLSHRWRPTLSPTSHPRTSS